MMTKSNFKVGDKVNYIGQDNWGVDNPCTVVGFNNYNNLRIIHVLDQDDIANKTTLSWRFEAHELEKIND